MTVLWLTTALRQLAKLLIDLEDYAGLQAVDNLQAKIDKKTRLLETQPKLYVEGWVKGSHELVVTANVVLVYRIQPRKKTVTIVRVLKPRMKRPATKKK
jgi:plasmid stabilization system protein ParE